MQDRADRQGEMHRNVRLLFADLRAIYEETEKTSIQGNQKPPSTW